jgi:cell division protein FtsW
MKRFYQGFSGLLTVVSILIIGGFLALVSVSMPLSLEKFGTSYVYAKHQLLYGILPGLALGFLAFVFPLQRLKKYIPYLFLLSFLILVTTFIPSLGPQVKGASRWIEVGPIRFQPSEFLKISFIFYWAYLISELRKQTKEKELFIAFWLLTIIIGGLLLAQPDMSTLVVIIATALVMYFVSGISWKKIAMMVPILLALAGAFAGLSYYRLARLKVFFHLEENPLGSGYQLRQQILSIGSGGLLGKGFGFSQQKFGFLPHSMSDSIYAIISEETGFIGALIVLILFGLFSWFSVKIIFQNRDLFSQLIAFGIVSWFIFQAIIHIGANLGLLPVSGIPLPFISYGGSALTAELMAVGFLFNVSRKKKN